MPPSAATSSPPVVYISYSRKDRDWRDRIVEHLRPFQANGTIALWDDQSVAPGEDWQKEAKKALDVAEVMVLLVSPNLIFSSYIADYEVPLFLAKGKRLIPVLLSPPIFKDQPWLASIQMYPRDGRSLEDLQPNAWDTTLKQLAEEVVTAVKTSSKKAPPKQTSRSAASKKSKGMGRVFGTKGMSIPPEVLRSEKDLNAIKEYLINSINEPRPKIVGICGPNAIGKTTLAHVLAFDNEVRLAFPDGVFYILPSRKGALEGQVRSILSDGLPASVKASSESFPTILSNRKVLLIFDDPDLDDGRNFSEIKFIAGFSRVLVITPFRRNLLRLQARIHELGAERLLESPQSISNFLPPPPSEVVHVTEPSTTEPPVSSPSLVSSEPKTRRIIQSHLVSTTSVAGDGEAEHLTPTAQRCMLALREFLVSDETHPPLTVAVEAPWGGGKSSLMRHLQDALINTTDKDSKTWFFKKRPVPTVWFNPWKHEAGKTLWAAFAVAFERQMSENCGFFKRISTTIFLSVARLKWMERLQLLLRLLLWIGLLLVLNFVRQHLNPHLEVKADWLAQLLKYAPLPAMVMASWGLLKDAVKQLGSPLKLDVSRLLTYNDHADKVDDLHRFHEDFRRMIRAYIPKRKKGKAGKVFVFVDDLDRCEAPKAAELLQSLHQMLNVQECSRSAADKDPPGIICVLGMDRKKVAAAVAAKHEKLLPLLRKLDDNGKVSQKEAMIFGHEFLEKFIQLTLHLPAMQGRDLEEYLESIIGVTEKQTQIHSSTVTVDQDNPATAAEAITSVMAQDEINRQEQQAAVERIEDVSEDLEDGSIVLQCARYAAVALENNPRKLKQFVNLFRLRLYLAAAMNLLDLPDRDAEKSDVEPLRSSPKDKLSVHHLAKLVALELAAPSEMTVIRETSSQRLYEGLEKAFPANGTPALHALLLYRDPYEPEAYDLSKASLHAYFHYFKAETPTT